MKDEYDFSNAKRGAVTAGKGKTRITIMLDDAVIEAARERAELEGYGYQTVINNTLRQALLHSRGSAPQPAVSAIKSKAKKANALSELQSLEQTLTEAINTLHRMMEKAPLPVAR
ncbi:BrnA antitoxin family protein [Pseudomonas sp. SZMC_28357]|uniref:BrnA antitoxin family protein n=1 Tax=Pseudomonas sp. SZMC_28357 TaxID=3074380 RepID=UPI00287274D8|nr:BrnA antitoxin family protein [Pseudomonas sp. SZMC_28357]MDR9754362.1 BrnA antitoxin family protein [Pseudomonas sp. SZMC_28357]